MRQRTQKTAAFTIIELLVATAVTAVLIGLMISMTSGILTAWNRTSGMLSANNQAKLILDQISQDFQSAILRYDPANPNSVGLAVEVLDQKEGHNAGTLKNRHGWVVPTEPQTVMMKPTELQDPRSFDLETVELADSRYGLGGVWLRFFTNSFSGNSADQTVPAAVSYQIVRRHVTPSTTTPNPAEVRYMLFRTEVTDANRLLEEGYDLASTGSTHYTNQELRNPRDADVIGNNVIDFGVRLYMRFPGRLDPIFPVNGSYRFSNNHTKYQADGSPFTVAGAARGPFPDVADVMVRILTSDGAQQIQNLEADRLYQGLSAAQKHEKWWDIAEANSRVFTRRIELTARPY